MTQSSATSPLFERYLALFSYFALLLWVLAWHGFISPHPDLNSTAVTVGWCIPLLLPFIGIIKGKPYTHAWANFILMFYFLHSLTILYIDNGERMLAAIELLLTSVNFVANILYARHKGKALGLKLTRLSEVEKQEKAKFESSSK
ncbi:DUF2069 domain-containing protein [Vibrio algivorus]|uniref:DUF2069 domain-containing protein n=1 Tax=Vibrio algivorus TaxID=1667024 RepID=A0A557PAB9_9VIBR|nr:DUF2069 domain-containing protein [Vibrio algivorus]TVO37606.1 DUF2069 domain-containing protein [Vibrio algivorus]GLT15637.1 membrane protein [Vibrio algivorus]